MNRADRIKSVLEYYLGTKLPPEWKCEETGGFLTVRNSKGKLSFRERDFLGKAQAWGVRFLLGLENQDSINLTYPWRLMELDYNKYYLFQIDGYTSILFHFSSYIFIYIEYMPL